MILSLEVIVANAPLTTVTSLLANPDTASENTSVTVDVSPDFSAVSLIVNELTVGAVVSITKAVKVRLLAFPAASVTVTVLFVYVPSSKVLNVTVLLPLAAEALVENPSEIFVVIVPASLVVNT